MRVYAHLWPQGLPSDDIRAAFAIGPKVAKAHAMARASPVGRQGRGRLLG
jgi:hypothetical protein